ncbi:hypothetical protein NDU88_001708, partial [Pleurodeles waltl]
LLEDAASGPRGWVGVCRELLKGAPSGPRGWAAVHKARGPRTRAVYSLSEKEGRAANNIKMVARMNLF